MKLKNVEVISSKKSNQATGRKKQLLDISVKKNRQLKLSAYKK
jgi:hypothetical protein